jgi:hypothetical protein
VPVVTFSWNRDHIKLAAQGGVTTVDRAVLAILAEGVIQNMEASLVVVT